MRYADETREIADATIYLGVLEKMHTGDTAGAVQTLNGELQAAFAGLRADERDLAPSQRKQVEALKRRAAGLETASAQ